MKIKTAKDCTGHEKYIHGLRSEYIYTFCIQNYEISIFKRLHWIQK